MAVSATCLIIAVYFLTQEAGHSLTRPDSQARPESYVFLYIVTLPAIVALVLAVEAALPRTRKRLVRRRVLVSIAVVLAFFCLGATALLLQALTSAETID